VLIVACEKDGGKMFRSRWRLYQHLVIAVVLTVLSGCGAATTPSVAVNSASSSGTIAGPSTVATTALIASPGTGSVAQALTSTSARSTAATTPARTSAGTSIPATSTGGNVTQALTFSGDLSGSFTSTAKPELCGKKDQDFGGTTIHHTFGAGLIQGTINNQRQGLAFTITDYHGPDTYKGAALVSLANLDTQDVFIGDGSVVVAPGETSGTIESDVQSEPPTKAAKVHVSGTWNCR
jgi:hypothetical protein